MTNFSIVYEIIISEMRYLQVLPSQIPCPLVIKYGEVFVTERIPVGFFYKHSHEISIKEMSLDLEIFERN